MLCYVMGFIVAHYVVDFLFSLDKDVVAGIKAKFKCEIYTSVNNFSTGVGTPILSPFPISHIIPSWRDCQREFGGGVSCFLLIVNADDEKKIV